MTQTNMLTTEEEREMRETYGYTDREIEMVSRGRTTIKAGEELIAMAAQDARRRLTGDKAQVES